MAWSDEPTKPQLNTIYQWLVWETRLPTSVPPRAIKYLKEHASRGDVAREMNRMKKLKDSKRLDRDTCFDSEIWKGFER